MNHLKTTFATKIGCFLVLLSLTNQIHAQKFDLWRNLQRIKPLISTKDDTDRLFSKHSKDQFQATDGSENYDLKQGDLSVKISDGVCRKGDWNPAKGKVDYLTFFFYKKHVVKFRDFVQNYQIDLTQFNRRTEPNTHYPDKQFVSYDLPDGSLHFSTSDDVYLTSIIISPPDGYEDPRCKNNL